MIVGVPRETYPGERRVALVPIVLPNLAKAGLEFIVEAGAGVAAGFPDADYAAKGAKICGSGRGFCQGGHHRTGAVPWIERPDRARRFTAASPRSGLIGFLRPMGSLETIQEIAAAGVTSFSR